MGLAGPRLPHLADAEDIIQWAQRITSRADLARLVRSLIEQTNDQVVTLEMRAGEGAEAPGYDGIVEATKGTAFVPKGRSVWELGTGGDPREKASDDYRERTKRPLGIDQANTTIVFVTPRRFEDKQAWIDRRRRGSPWPDIKVFDVDNIEEALEQAPGAHLIFSDRINKPALGVKGIEKWWEGFCRASNPPLTAEMVLVGRENDAAKLTSLLEQEVRQTTISSSGPDEVLAFVAAVLLSEADEDRRMGLLGRTLIVYEPHALRFLEHTAKLLILLPFDESLHREAQLLRSHHLVLLAPLESPADIRLGRIDQQRFAQLLEAAGVQAQRASMLAGAASRSLVAFQRQAATGIPLRPEWTASFRSRALRLAWLTGGWNEDRSGDLDVLSGLVGRRYEEFAAELGDAARGIDPLFTRVGVVWGVASPEAAWEFAAPLIERADLDAVGRAIEIVLGAIDPALDLPMDQRWASAIYGKSRIHSTSLRNGLATTVALLGAYGEAVDIGGGASARNWAQLNVRRLLQRANIDDSGELWASLNDVLPLLAEAGPDEFVSAVMTGASE